MEDAANSPILIYSDDEDDDVVLVKEEKGAVHVVAQEKQDNDESDEDVIFVAQESRQSSKKMLTKVSLGQHDSKTNLSSGSSRRNSESSDDDTFVLPQMKTVPSMSSISLINDILRPLDLSQSHQTAGTTGRNSPSHTCSSINSSNCCPLKHSVCSEHLHKVQTGSTNTSTQAASLQTAQLMICPKANTDVTPFSPTSPLCSVVIDSTKICPSPDDSTKESQECPDNSFMASSLETSAAKVDLSFETKDIKSSGKVGLDSSGTTEKSQSAFEVQSSKASLEKGDLNPSSSSSSNSGRLQGVTKADSVDQSSEESGCSEKDSDHKLSSSVLSENLSISTTTPVGELSEKIKLDVDNIDKDEWSSLLAFLSDISPEEISTDDNKNKEKVGECSKQVPDSPLVSLSQDQTTVLPATLSITPVLGTDQGSHTKDIMSPKVTSTSCFTEKQFCQVPLHITMTGLSTAKNSSEKGNSLARLQGTQYIKDKEARLVNRSNDAPVVPLVSLLSIPKVEQTSMKACTSKDDPFQTTSVLKNQSQSSLSKKDKVIDIISSQAEHQTQTSCDVSFSKSKASCKYHSSKMKKLKMVRFQTTVNSYEKTCSGLKNMNREIQSLFSRNEAVDKNQDMAQQEGTGICDEYKISQSEKGEMCKKFIRIHSAPSTSDASSSFISGKNFSRLPDDTSHASDTSVNKSKVIDSTSASSDSTSSKQDRAIVPGLCSSSSCTVKSDIPSASQSFSNLSCVLEKAGPSTAMHTCDDTCGYCSYKVKKKMARLDSTLVSSDLQTEKIMTCSVVCQTSTCDPKESVALRGSSTKPSTPGNSVGSSDVSRDDRQQKSHWSKVSAPASRDTCLKRQHSMISAHLPKNKAIARSFHRSVSDNAVHKSGVDVNKPEEGDAKGELTPCTKCASPQRTENLSRCMLGHVICQLCLESQVKAILTGSVKQKNIKCPEKFCFEILTFEELKKTLPQFVVDILEEKLDKEYLGYITKWMFTDDSQLKSRSEFATSDSRTPPCPAVNMRKYEEIYAQESRDTTEDLPTFWAPMERGAPVTVYEVAPETEEYMALAVQFHDSLRFPEHDIVRIIRVQNPILWKYFALKRSEMVQDNDGMDVAETQLYHGTHRSSLEAIARKGFDWRLSGKHGTVYGCGSYFARDAGYSHGYTDCGGSAISVKNTMHKRGLLTSHLLNPFTGLRSVSSGFFSTLPPPPPLPLFAPPPPPPAHSHFPLPPPAHGQKPQGFACTPMLHPLQNPWLVTSSQAHTTGSCAKASDDAVFSPRSTNPSKSISKPLPNSSSGSSENTRRRNEKGNQDLAVAFARSLNSQTHFMFVARVLVGRHTGGSSDLKRPPPLDKNCPFGKSYDSCVDNIFSPRVFVVFDNNQAYPEYIIEYTWERNA